jgi:hypothetical protein
MFTTIRLLISIVAGSVLGWFFLGFVCGITGLRGSVACGHNAYIWLPLCIPLGVFICWYLLGLLQRYRTKAKHNKLDRNAGGT